MFTLHPLYDRIGPLSSKISTFVLHPQVGSSVVAKGASQQGMIVVQYASRDQLRGRHVGQELSDRQRSILACIVETQEQGWTPSVREIAKAVGLSSTAVHNHLATLQDNGYIQRLPGKMRAIEVLQGAAASTMRHTVPVVGEIAAGEPILAEENLDGHLSLIDEDTARGGEVCFALRVKGESMIEAGILPGDHVIVQQQDTADNGDIVVALLDQEATVKYFYREQDHVRLEPANAAMTPVIAKEVRILGKVVSVFRKLA